MRCCAFLGSMGHIWKGAISTASARTIDHRLRSGNSIGAESRFQEFYWSFGELQRGDRMREVFYICRQLEAGVMAGCEVCHQY